MKNQQAKRPIVEERKENFENEMRSVEIFTPDEKTNLLHLVKYIGVKERVRYYNEIENKDFPGTSEKKFFDFGFTFSNGLEIRGINKKFFTKLIDYPIKEKRERIPGLKPYPASLPFD